MKHTRIAFAAVALTSAFSLVACARTGTRPAADNLAPAAAQVSAVPEPPAASGSAGTGPETPETSETPIPEPTVAKTQKWVKIYSGESDEPINPPKSIRTGSKIVELNATENATIGTYVTDGAGRTLYRFDDDSARPPKATCNGDCADAWPPLLIKSPGKIFPKGINPKILGYVERVDGTCQVTVNGWPVYYFAKDEKPGDILGQGAQGKWFAVGPTGGKTKATPAQNGAGGAGTGGAGTAQNGAESDSDDAPADPNY